jgi:hypothetical protein
MKFTIRQLFAILLFVALFDMALRPIADADFWWHLRTGQLIVETRTIPLADPFSFTNLGKPWIAHEWLVEILIYGLFRLGGFGLLILIFAAFITATFYLVYLRSEGRPYIAGFVLLLGALASAPTWGVRPQIITYLFFASFLLLLDRYAVTCKAKYLIPLPFLMLLWVNLHAAYALGIALVGLYLTGAVFEWIKAGFGIKAPRLREVFLLGSILAICLLATLANPNGLRLLTYPFETLSSQAMQQNIQEWFSPDFHRSEWQPLLWLILALIGAGLLGRKKLSPVNILLTLAFGYLALHSMRHVPLFAIAAVPALAEMLSAILPNLDNTRPALVALKWVNPLLVVVAIFVVIVQFTNVIQKQATTEKEYFPTAAVDWIAHNHPTGNIFNTYGWGGYLIWRLYPEYQVYIDGRADLYGDAFIGDYLRIESGSPGWEAELVRDNVRIVLLEPTSSLVWELRHSADWQVVYEDARSVLFVSK